MSIRATGSRILGCFLANSMILVPTADAHHPNALRDPFTNLQQEQTLHPDLLAQLEPWQAAQQLRQWCLYGVLGNHQRGLWGLIHRPPNEWRCIRAGEQWLGYQIVILESQRVLLRCLQTLPATSPNQMISLPIVASSAISTVRQP